MEKDKKINVNQKQMQNQIIEDFIPSNEMRKYLKTQDLSKYALFDIIAGSLKCTDYKHKWIKRLFDMYNPDDWVSNYDNSRIINSLENAIKGLTLKPNELFTLKENWYDEDIRDDKEYFAMPFVSFNKVCEFIINDMTCDGSEPEFLTSQLENCCWYTLDKWSFNDETGKYINTYTYYLIGTAVVYYRHHGTVDTYHKDWFIGLEDLNLPIPYKQGDIVSIDCRPFYPVFPALILTVGDNNDCCSVQIMKLDSNGKWEVRSLKHNTSIKDFPFPMVSPLYNLKKNTEKLSDEYDPLIRIAQELKYENKFRGINDES